MTGNDQDLLRQFTGEKSQDAFTSLVKRYLNLVYSAALRQVRSPQLAEEVSQSVFADLATSAPKLKTDTILPAWLYQVTRRTAIDVVRRESRRQARERLAVEMAAMNTTADWMHIEPMLDEAMAALDETDRTAILLRYFENQSLREVGESLGASDDAAQKRVSRAVERLREFFAKRGVALGVGGIIAAVSTNAVQAAPIGLAATILTAAPAATALTSTFALTAKTNLTTMSLFTFKTAAVILTTAIVATSGTLYVAKQHEQQLRDENQDLAAKIDKLSAERDQALRTAAQTAGSSLPDGEKNDLLRLRGEVGRLRNQQTDLEQLQTKNRQLETALNEKAQTADQAPDETPAQKRAKIGTAKLNDARMVCLGLIMYSADNQGQFPGGLDKIVPYMQKGNSPLDGTNQFELVYQGPQNAIANPADTVIIREKEPLFMDGAWFKTYGYADGHTQFIRQNSQAAFADYEKQHIIAQ